MASPNPYEPTLYGGIAVEHAARRWIVFAVFSGIIGIACAVLGILVFKETIGIARRQRFDIDIVHGLLAGAVFLMFGTAWIVAARLHFKKRHGAAGMINVAAAVIFLLIFGYLCFQ